MKTEATHGDTTDNSLSRSMGPISIFATVVAGTLGSGLFVTIGTASGTTGPSVILGVLVVGLIAIPIAVNYGWTATIFPGAGGAYTLVSRSFNSRFWGFVVTWSKWLGYMAADAVLAIGFGNYLTVFFPSVDPVLVGFVLLTVLFIINLFGIEGYSTAQNAMFWFLLACIFFLIIPGLGHIHTASYTPFFTGGATGFLAALVPLFYAFIGIEVGSQFGAEVKNPGRNLPLGIIGGTTFLVVLYLWTAIVIYGLVSDYTVLANSGEPLSTAAKTFLGEIGVAVITVGGLLATATSVHAVMAAGIKIPYSWSWDKIAPPQLSTVSRRFRTPHWSLVTLYVISAALTFWSGGLEAALSLATFAYLIAYLTVALAVGHLYLNRPDTASRAAFHPGRWLYVTVIIAALGSLLLLSQAANWVAFFTGHFEGNSTLVIYIPWLIIGLILFAIYWLIGRRRGDDAAAILDTIPGVSEEAAGRETDEK